MMLIPSTVIHENVDNEKKYERIDTTKHPSYKTIYGKKAQIKTNK